MIDALIFDMDGVIADTVTLHNRSWKRIMDELNVPYDLDVMERTRGLSRRGIFNLIFGDAIHDERQIEHLMARKNAHFLELMQTLTPDDVLPGIREWIAQGRERGLRVAVGSASQNARPVLTQLGLGDAFDVIGDGTSIVNPKPAPDIFIWVAGALRVNPARVLVIEDGAAGIEAAHRAGARVIGVGSGDIAQADLRLPSLDTLTLTEALTQLETRIRS